jgi:hypothetical protein
MAFSEADIIQNEQREGYAKHYGGYQIPDCWTFHPHMNRPKAISASIGRPIRMANSAPQLLIAIHVPTMGKRNVVVENVKSRTPSKNGVSPAQNVSSLLRPCHDLPP